MKTYRGVRDADRVASVFVKPHGARIERRLRPRRDLFNHSPTGFEWGYPGSGPSQLALALLADALDDDVRAVRLHQRFKFEVVAKLDRDKPWAMTDDEVRAYAAGLAEPDDDDRMGVPVRLRGVRVPRSRSHAGK